MSQILKWIGYVSIIGGIILGIVYGIKSNPLTEALRVYDDSFRWAVAFTWWISGSLSGVLFIAFSMMLDLLEENNAHLKELLHRTHGETTSSSKPQGRSKSSLSSLSGYKMGNSD
ncbi:hypothetical protein YSY43_22840 [Paenibacillus sp. YSY-4.3]